MTREDIVEKVNALLAEEFEVTQKSLSPTRMGGTRFP